jgi:predicted PurR-regulated permease PerM
LVVTAILIAALYYGRPVLIPFALALLLSFLLTPPVSWLERLKLGRPLSVVLVLVIAFSALSALVWLGATQLADVVNMVPSYQENIHRKIQAMQQPGRLGL